MKKFFMQKHKGVVGFEYMVILIIMLVAIYAVFSLLSQSISSKAAQIDEFIRGNGQNPLGGNGNTALPGSGP